MPQAETRPEINYATSETIWGDLLRRAAGFDGQIEIDWTALVEGVAY